MDKDSVPKLMIIFRFSEPLLKIYLEFKTPVFYQFSLGRRKTFETLKPTGPKFFRYCIALLYTCLTVFDGFKLHSYPVNVFTSLQSLLSILQ